MLQIFLVYIRSFLFISFIHLFSKNMSKVWRNLMGDLTTNIETAIKKDVSNIIFYLLFVKLNYIIYYLLPNEPRRYQLCFVFFKPGKKSVKVLSNIRNLLWSNLVFRTEESKVEIGLHLLKACCSTLFN